jgi:hypothetical protein
MGYSDTLGKIKIEPKYDTVSLFDYDIVYKGNHVIAEVKLNGKPMIINEKGISVVPPKYDYIKLINGSEEPTFIISRNNKFGLFSKGKELFPAVSDWLSDTYPGLYELHTNGKYGLINSKGEILIPVIYDQLRPMGSKTPGFMDWQCISYSKEPEILSVKLPKENWHYQRVPQTEELDYNPKDNINKIIDSATKEFGLDSVLIKYNNAAIFYKGSAKGIILPDVTKKVYIFSKRYNIHYIKYFSPWSRNSWNSNSAAYIIVSLKGKLGMINEREEQVLPFEYDNIEERDRFFLLNQNGKIGFFIWNTIHPVIQPAFDEYLWKVYIPVNNGWRFTLFKIVKNGRTGFVGETGLPISKIRFHCSSYIPSF